MWWSVTWRSMSRSSREGGLSAMRICSKVSSSLWLTSRIAFMSLPTWRRWRMRVRAACVHRYMAAAAA